MKVSLSIPEEFMVTNHGYGQVSREVVFALQRLGHTVPFRDPTAPVHLNIGQPYHWVWPNRDALKIGLVAWESSEIPKNWRVPMRYADQLWATSPQVARWYEAAGFPVTRVYEHGVDSKLWTPKLRKARPGRPIRFLHIGEPAPRKGGQLVYDAFKEAFGGSSEAKLTIKAHSHSTIRGRNNAHPFKELKNVSVITDDVPDEEMASIVHHHDVFIYPSYGEGFGLIPLQAMITGMPTICTEAWAPYSNFILPENRLASREGPSLWPQTHPGNVFHPDYNDLVKKMKAAVENFDDQAQRALNLVPFLQKKYNWDRLTAEAFDDVRLRFDL